MSGVCSAMPDMARVIAEHGAPVIIMHNRETADPAIDIIAEVTEFFSRSLEIAWDAGIGRDQIVLDPGIGFGKTPEQSLACLARLDAWRDFDLPLLVGASRKRFINSITPSEPMERLGGSLAAHLLAVEHGADHHPHPRRRAHGTGVGCCRGNQARPMSDAIFVTGLSLHAYHGVMQHEAKVGQTFRLDLVLDIDLAEASRTDKLKDTVSYDTVVKTVSEAFCKRRYQLVEAAAGAVADAVLEGCPLVRSCSHHRAQAARPDRRDLRRRRRDDRRACGTANMAEPPAGALLALGGNIGDVRSAFDRAIAMLCDGTAVRLVARSADYRTPPWGVTDQPPFHQCGYRCGDFAQSARSDDSRDRGGMCARPRPEKRTPLGPTQDRYRRSGL